MSIEQERTPSSRKMGGQMTEPVETVIIGGGQAWFALSFYLTRQVYWLLSPSVRKKLSQERESVSSIVADRGATRVQFENVDRCLHGCEELYASSSRRSS